MVLELTPAYYLAGFICPSIFLNIVVLMHSAIALNFCFSRIFQVLFCSRLIPICKITFQQLVMCQGLEFLTFFLKPRFWTNWFENTTEPRRCVLPGYTFLNEISHAPPPLPRNFVRFVNFYYGLCPNSNE